MGRVILAMGPVTAATAWFLGTPWPMALAGLAVWLLAWRPGWTGRLAPLIGILLLTTAAPLPTLASWQAAAWLGLITAVIAVWALSTGAVIPLRGIGIVPVAALLLMPMLLDWAPTFLSSDVATRAQVLALAVAVMLATVVVRVLRQSRPLPW